VSARWPSRRRWIGSTVSVLGLGALGVGRALQERRARVDDRALRPPGALDEDGLLAACVRCGLCVQACPYATLQLARSGEAVAVGTPFFRARAVPCEMCRDIPCVRACPTGALASSLHDIERARMGRASLSRPEGCYSFTGAAACNSCFRACPLKGRAIAMKPGLTRLGGRLTPTVDADVCTGCGKCEKACIAEVAAITVSRVHGSRAQG
jgi:ferredoxin-type protein NapG